MEGLHGIWANLPRAGYTQKSSDCTKWRIVRKATETHETPLKKLQASADETRKTVPITADQSNFYESGKENAKVKENSYLILTRVHL